MTTLPARLQAVVASIRERRGLRPALLGLGSAVLIAIGLRLINAWTNGFLTDTIWPVISDYLLRLATLPIGIVLLAAVVFICVLTAIVTLLAWWDTSPFVAARLAIRASVAATGTPSTPAPVSLEDRESIQAARILWKENGYLASTHAAWTLEEIRTDLNTHTPLGYLLSFPSGKLRKEIELVGSALHDYSQQPMTTVMHRLDQLFIAYMQTARWIHATQEYHDIELSHGPHGERYQKWRSFHDAFLRDFRKLALRSDYSSLSSCFQDGNDADRFVRE